MREDPKPNNRITKDLRLPEGVQLKVVRNKKIYVLEKDGEVMVGSDRSWELADNWRNPGRTMSFVARYCLRQKRNQRS